MAPHTGSEAPKSSGWVAVRIAAIALCALQSGQAARFFAEGRVWPALLVVTFAVVGVVVGMISLMRPSHELLPPTAGDTDAPPPVARWDWKVSLAFASFFLAVVVAGVARAASLRSLPAIVGLLGFAVAVTLAVRELRARRRLA